MSIVNKILPTNGHRSSSSLAENLAAFQAVVSENNTKTFSPPFGAIADLEGMGVPLRRPNRTGPLSRVAGERESCIEWAERDAVALSHDELDQVMDFLNRTGQSST